ncbi:foldase protein PrsA [Geobacter sp. OR-1]|uniref:peptidylprolyl isomerase n=1 Tax=Geobacter sp. OR-1 TaxID=1266765 RepID=UPI000541F0B4|nr:peptidylprolyl isomerase [Geobacter sp. OR-1]GAM08554.1 foldase protein PrsA [Geobacter sp. OR-1]
MPRILKSLAVIAASVALIAGCSAKKAEDGPKPAKGGGEVLAEVNGATITTEDFKKEMENLPPYLKPMTETAEGKKEMLETMVIRELILQQAKKDGVDKSQLVADKLEELKKRLVVEAYLKKKVEEQANISDADLKKFYDENKDKFKSGDQIKASHILVKDEKLAKDILAQIKAGGSFEELAKKNSMDSAGAKGGDLGWFSKGSMLPEFEKVAFGLKEGEISGLVKTKFGYHIIKLTGKRAAGQRDFAEVKDQIKAALLPSKQKEVFDKLKDELKKSSKYTIKEDVLKKMDGGSDGADKGKQPEEPKTAPPAPEKK